MNGETLKAMKEQVRHANTVGQQRFLVETAQQDALITEYERVVEENKRLCEDLRILTKGRFIQS